MEAASIHTIATIIESLFFIVPFVAIFFYYFVHKTENKVRKIIVATTISWIILLALWGSLGYLLPSM